MRIISFYVSLIQITSSYKLISILVNSFVTEGLSSSKLIFPLFVNHSSYAVIDI